LVAWGFTDAGARVLLSVLLGMRESDEDWQALGRDLIARVRTSVRSTQAAGGPRRSPAIAFTRSAG
jgi:hypothetical protein